MPEIVYHVATSLDGFITDKKGLTQLLIKKSGEKKEFEDFFSSFDAIIIGGLTYDVALKAGYWMSPNTPTWVMTRRDLNVLHPSITITKKSPKDVCKQLDQQGMKRIWLMGGGKLAASFLDAGLLDEVDLSIVPVILGEGVPVIGKTEHEPMLSLKSHGTFTNGVVSVKYAPKR